MKTKTLLLATTATLMAAAPASAAHTQGWYIGLEGGVNWVQTVDIDSGVATFVTTNVFANLNSGWALLGTVGYDFGSLRVEFEAGYRDNNVATFTTVPGPFTLQPANDSLNEITLMANVLFDVPLSSNIALALGGGLGAADETFNIASTGSGSASTWSFAYQGIAGLSYSIPSSNWDVTLNYRYLDVADSTFTFSPPTLTTNNITKHTLTIGLRFDLNPPP